MKSLLKLPFLFAVLLASAAHAQVTVATDAAELHATDSVSWSQIGPEGTAGFKFSAVSANGIHITVSGSAYGLQRMDQGSFYQGNFATGSKLLYSGSTSSLGFNTNVSFTFDRPVLAAGFYLSSFPDPKFIFGESASWIYTPVNIFNFLDSKGLAVGNPVESFVISSNNSYTGVPAFPARFFGFNSTTPISSFVLNGWNNAAGSWFPLAIDTMQFQAAPVANEPSVTPVPEPSTYGLMGAGALALLGLARRSRRRKL